jgi:hypothetical protein
MKQGSEGIWNSLLNASHQTFWGTPCQGVRGSPSLSAHFEGEHDNALLNALNNDDARQSSGMCMRSRGSIQPKAEPAHRTIILLQLLVHSLCINRLIEIDNERQLMMFRMTRTHSAMRMACNVLGFKQKN